MAERPREAPQHVAALRTRHTPAARLSLAPQRERQALSALASIAFHGAIIVAILWGGKGLFVASKTPGGPGQRGGGGGGGSERVMFFELPALAQPAPVQAQDIVFRPPTPDLRDLQIEIPEVNVPQQQFSAADYGSVFGRGEGTGGGTGAGTGTGGGVGAGRGTGVGDSIGPGTGGGGGRIFQPVPIGVILAPLEDVPGSLKGREIAVTFHVDVRGTVTRVETVPGFGGDYGRRFRERMMSYRFRPAFTIEGESVAGSTVILVRLPG